MQAFLRYTPTEIVFGKGAENKIAELAKKHGGSRIMLVYGGGSVVQSGLLERLETFLKRDNLAVCSFGGARPNPMLSHARDGIKRALEFKADMIIAVGGGSSIDTAKGIAHGAANPDVDIWSFWIGEAELSKSLPICVVLTISAAGSETSDSAVLTDDESGAKRGFSTEKNRPSFALMNPELTYSLPPRQIACGIVDIYMHTLDRYFNTEGNELTTQIAEAVMRVTIENGPKALKNPSDYDAMSELMWCGSLSHDGLTGLGAPRDFSVHALGHELSGMFDIAHGESLSIMWDSWAKYTYKTGTARFARYAENVWGINEADTEASALKGMEKTVNFFKSLNMPTCFSEARMGVQSDAVISDLALRCTYYKKRIVGQFRKLELEDLCKIYSLSNR